MAGIRVNAAGVVKTVLGLYVNDNGVVKPVQQAYVNEAGVVKKFWPDVAPPNAPANFRSTAAGTNSITYAWDAAVANGSPVTGYRIEYGTDGVTFGSFADFGVVLTGSISGLAANTTYYARVKANSALGYGPVSNVVTQATQNVAAPLAPTVSNSPTGMTANSTPVRVTPAATGSLPTHYDVQYRILGSTGAWSAAQSFAYTGASPQTCTLTGLASNTAYETQARSRNAVGSSAYVVATNSAFTTPSGSNGTRTSTTAVDPEDVGTFKDVGYGLNSASEGGSGQVFGTLSGNLGAKVTERIARTGSATFAIWVQGTPVSTYIRSIRMYPGTAANSLRARSLKTSDATFGLGGVTGTVGIWSWNGTYTGDLAAGESWTYVYEL
jgi:Fibronectin type III domain